MRGFQLQHVLVPQLQVLVPQVVRVGQGPLATGVLVAVAIALPRKVNPLWVSKLVAHEVQPRLAAQRAGDETDVSAVRRERAAPNHLMQSDASVDDGRQWL